MTNYSEVMAFFLLLPVLTQIIIPLLMLVGFGVLRVVRLVFGAPEMVEGRKNRTAIEEELQLSRS
jgi:uncharacterized membrane protein